MSPATLLARLRAQGVRIANEAGHLVLEEVGDPLPDDVLSQVRAMKTDLLGLLRRERERPTQCPSGACPEPGAVEHGARCVCRPCLDLDPEMEDLRARVAAEDAAARADAEYEAAEREAIQAESCTAAELEVIRKTKEAVATAAAAGADLTNEGPPSERPGPWSWTDPENTSEDVAILRAIPENTSEDVAILRAIERLDREEARDTAESSCYGCGGRDWWTTRGGHRVCRTCHSPVPGAEAAQVLATDPAAGATEGA